MKCLMIVISAIIRWCQPARVKVRSRMLTDSSLATPIPSSISTSLRMSKVNPSDYWSWGTHGVAVSGKAIGLMSHHSGRRLWKRRLTWRSLTTESFLSNWTTTLRISHGLRFASRLTTANIITHNFSTTSDPQKMITLCHKPSSPSNCLWILTARRVHLPSRVISKAKGCWITNIKIQKNSMNPLTLT